MKALDFERLVGRVLAAIGKNDALWLGFDRVEQLEHLGCNKLRRLADACSECPYRGVGAASAGPEGIVRSAVRTAERLRHPVPDNLFALVHQRQVGLIVEL